MKVKNLFVGDTENTFVQFFRYCFVGGFAFVVDFGIMTLFAELFSIHPVVAATISFIVGLAVNYVLSTFWIFRNSKIKSRFAEFLAFALIGVIGLLINDGIIWIFQNVLGSNLVFGGWSSIADGETKYFIFGGIQYYHIGKIVSTVVVFLWNFFARKFLLFNKNAKKTKTEDE